MHLEPRENSELFGHQNEEDSFISAWNSSRLPHAWLLGGTRGIGKASFAYRVARYVLSQPANSALDKTGLFSLQKKENTLYLASEDPLFRKIASGGHPDLLTLQRTVSEKDGRLSSSISVEEVRSSGNFLRLTPAEGGWRVLIIDSADDLNLNAANALLKILEEPSLRTIILLVSHLPSRLLPTIRSRCCRLNFKPLSLGYFTTVVQKRLPSLNNQLVEELFELSSGSPGKAVLIHEQDGLLCLQELITVLKSFPANQSTSSLHGLADQLGASGREEKFRITLDLFCSWLSRQIREKTLNSSLRQHQNTGLKFIDDTKLDVLLELWNKIRNLSERALQQNLDRKSVLLSVFSMIRRASRD
ncbi:MAG: DNA polymerase III subunit delta' [Pseudomonadota bacterium]|nr:DNA polymerase III subunit delta' [Pseudomonadota bacterium]